MRVLSPRNLKLLSLLATIVIVFIFLQYLAETQAASGNVRPPSRTIVSIEPPSSPPATTTTDPHYVVLSSNTDLERAFQLPLSVLVWKHRYHFNPIVILIGTETEWNATGLDTVVKHLKQFGAQIIYLSPFPLELPSTLLDLEDSAYVLTSDTEMWPINSDVFFIRDSRVLVTNANCCGSFTHSDRSYDLYSLNHIAMSFKTWKEVMNINDNNIQETISQQLKTYFPSPTPSDATQFDMRLISMKIQNWNEFPSQVELRNINTRFQRIGRTDWSTSVSSDALTKYEYAVLPKNPFNPIPWQHVSSVLSLLAGIKRMDAVISYYTEWTWNVPIVAPMTENQDTSPALESFTFPLLTAVAATEGPVLEMGSGYSSTPLLHSVCKNRYIFTADTDMKRLSNFFFLQNEWHKLVIVPVFTQKDGTLSDGRAPSDKVNASKWDEIGNGVKWGVVFVDHKPLDRRSHDVLRFKDSADIIVVHDTEAGTYEPVFRGFRYRKTWSQFKIQTTLLSQTIDVSELFSTAEFEGN